LLSGASQSVDGDGSRIVPDLRCRADRKELPVKAKIAAVTSEVARPSHVSQARQQGGKPRGHADCGVAPRLKMRRIIDRTLHETCGSALAAKHIKKQQRLRAEHTRVRTELVQPAIVVNYGPVPL